MGKISEEMTHIHTKSGGKTSIRKMASKLLVFREFQIKTMKYNYTSIRIAKTWKTNNTKCW